MRILSLILLTFALPLAAEVQIESLQAEHGNGTYRFPKLLGTGDAVKRINTYLHAIELKLLPDSFESSPFENIWPKEGEIWGVTRLDYHVDRYGPGFLAVTIESDTGGAFTSRQSINYLFDLASGQPIILEQLLSESGLRNLHAQLRQQRSQRITDFLSGEIITNGRDGRAVSLDSSNPERAALQRSTYEQCRQTRLGRSIDEEHVHLGSQHLTMSIRGCMLPYIRDLDALGDFENLISYRALEDDLTPYGHCLLIKDGANCKRPPDIRAGGVYQGSLDGSIPITLVLSHKSRNHLSSALYRGAKVEYTPLEGDASVPEYRQLYESSYPPAHFELRVDKSGELTGIWQQQGGKTLPVQLR